jgi:hypothetical protein
MPNNSNSADSQSWSLPDFNQMVTWTLMRLPPERPRADDARSVIIDVQKNILLVIEETARMYERLQKPAQQKAAELQWSLENSPYKTLINPKDPKDRSTARGYLLAEHNFDHYNSEATLRAALTKYGIPIRSDTEVIKDIRTGERINLGDTVLESDLDRFIQEFRAKKTAQKQVERRRPKDP